MKLNSLLRLRLVTAALLLCLAAPLALAQHSAIAPAPRSEPWWKERAQLLNDRIQQTPDAQVLFIGDSITQGWEGEGKEVWATYYGPRQAVNLGIGGDRTQHVLWRLDHGNLEGVKPKAAVIMIGTNNSGGDDNTPGQIAEGVAAIVQRLRTRLPDTQVLLLGIFPRGENFNNQRGKLAQINQVLQKLADGRHVHYLDIGHVFLTPEGLLPAALMPDYLHLSPAGYQLWAAAIEPTLAGLLADQPVAPAAGTGLAGRWIWMGRGPNGEGVEMPMLLTVAGNRVAGEFQLGDGRKMAIEDGLVSGDELTFKVQRTRPQGGVMVYQAKARLVNGKLEGSATAEMDGQPVTVPWTARRE